MRVIKLKKKGKKWYKSFSNWLVIIVSVILVPVLISNLYIIFQSKANKDKVPSVFGYKPFIVLSGSMEGKIHKGDLIITKIVDSNKLKKDDIIAFRDAENTITTHRIIDVIENNGKKQFITKGDNNSTQDRNLVNLEDVEGIYIMRIGGFGSVMKSLSDPMIIMALAFVITVIFIMAFMISMKKDSKKEKLEFMQYKMMKELEEKQRKEQELNEPRRFRETPDEIQELRRYRERPEEKKDEFDDYFKF